MNRTPPTQTQNRNSLFQRIGSKALSELQNIPHTNHKYFVTEKRERSSKVVFWCPTFSDRNIHTRMILSKATVHMKHEGHAAVQEVPGCKCVWDSSLDCGAGTPSAAADGAVFVLWTLYSLLFFYVFFRRCLPLNPQRRQHPYVSQLAHVRLHRRHERFTIIDIYPKILALP